MQEDDVLSRRSTNSGSLRLGVSIATPSGRRAYLGRAPSSGFTLLEVMIALAILAMSLITLSNSYQNSVRAASRSRLMTVATLLARYKMVEVEDDLFKDGFSDFEEEETGDFKDEDFDRYTYVLKVDKVELPKSVNNQEATALMGSSTGGSSSSSSSGGSSSPLDMLGGGMLSQSYDMIRKVLEKSIRRVQLSVKWKEGAIGREVTVVAYFTDARSIGAAASGQITPNSLSSGTGSTPSFGVPASSPAPASGSTTPSTNPAVSR